MGDTHTSPVKGFALATLSWRSPIGRPRIWHTPISAQLRPGEVGTPKSEQLPMSATVQTWMYLFHPSW